MKKITYLLFLALGVTACSVESLDSTENLTVADIKAKIGASEITTLDEENVYTPPQKVCAGEEAEFLFTFPQKVKGNGELQSTNVKVQIYNEDIEDWEQVLHDGYNTVATLKYTFEEVKVYQLRYFIGGGGHTEVSVNVENCNPVCPRGKGYWKNHSSNNPGEQENMWPLSELTLGNTLYDQDQLNDIMDAPNNEGNNLIIFSQHLIAAKLNVANGAGTTEIATTIAEADELIGDLLVLVDSFSKDQKELANGLKEILEAFNEADCE